MSTLKSISPLLLLAALGLPARSEHPEDPRALMFLARAKQQQAGGDDARGAVQLYQKAVALEPGSCEAHLRLSEALVEANDTEAAVAPALKATELNPGNGEAWVNLGMIQSLRSQTRPAAKEQARDAFQQAARLLPNDADVWFRLAKLDQGLGDTEGALKAWLGLGRMHPSGYLSEKPLEVVAWEQATLLGANLGRYEARREAVMALCELDRPGQQHLRLLEELAKEQTDKGFLGHAEESFLLLGTHFPLEPAISENIASIQLHTGRFAEALETYRRAEMLRPSAKLSYFEGLCLMNLGRLSEAETLWREFFSHTATAPDDDEMRQNARFFYAASILLQGRPGDALALLQDWPESGKDGELLALRTQACIQTRAWKNALALLEDGMKRFPDQALFEAAKAAPPGLLKDRLIFRKEMTQALMQMDFETTAGLWSEFQQWAKCLESVRLARETAPGRRIGLYMMQSTALDQLGRPAEAIRALREAQKLDPAYPMLQNNLGYLILENGGDLLEASRLIEASMKQDPKNGSTVDSWGWALYKQGRFKEAEEALRKAVELLPYNPEIRKHLGEILLKLDRPQEALEQWERALPFAFPGREALEAQAEKLRIELAKKERAQEKASEQETAEDSAPEEDIP